MPQIREPPDDRLQVTSKDVVALLVGVLLLAPYRERVRRGRDGSETVAVGNFGYCATKADELLPDSGDVGADPRADFDLGTQELRTDLAFENRVAFVEHRIRWLCKVARIQVDQEILLFDPDRKWGALLLPGLLPSWHDVTLPRLGGLPEPIPVWRRVTPSMNDYSELESAVIAALDGYAIPYELIPCDPELADTAAFCEHYGYPLDKSLNTIVVATKRDPKEVRRLYRHRSRPAGRQ